MNTRLLNVLASLALAAGTATVSAQTAAVPNAGEVAGTGGTPIAEELLRRELRSAVARVIESGAFAGTDPEAIAVSLTLPPERTVELGLLVDARADGDGVVVLGTSPGGAVRELGLRAGDRIVAVDDQLLTGLGRDAEGQARAVMALRAAVSERADGEPVRLAIERDGRPMQLSGTVASRYLPALRLELGEGSLVAATGAAAATRRLAEAAPAASSDSCGRISTFHIAPRQRDLYKARVVLIDGKIPGPSNQDTYRVAPGRHVVEVVELIDTIELPRTFTRIRDRIGRKTLEVEVEPGVTSMISARLNTDARNEAKNYWDPVVWKEIPEPCN